MKKSITAISTVFSVVAGISFAFAQQPGQVNISPLQNLLGGAQALVSQAVPFLIGLAVITFFYGLVMFIWKGKEGGENLTKSKQFMMYSLVAIFVMVSIWGIIVFMQNILGLGNVRTIVKPEV